VISLANTTEMSSYRKKKQHHQKKSLMQKRTDFAKHGPERWSLEAQAEFMGLGLDFTDCSAAGQGCGL